MPRVAAAPPALVATVCAAALVLASCGGGSDAKLLPGETAEEIKENLDSVQRLVDEGECIEAEDAALEVAVQVESLRGIDPELKQVLQRGADRLNEVVDTCESLAEDTVEETETETTEADALDKDEQKQEEKALKQEEKELEKEEKEAEKEEEEQQKEEERAEKEEEEEPKPPVEEVEEVEENDEPSGGIGPGGATEAG